MSTFAIVFPALARVVEDALGPASLSLYDAAGARSHPQWPWITPGPPVGERFDLRLRRTVAQVVAAKGLPVNTPACNLNGAINTCSLDADAEVLLAIVDMSARNLAVEASIRFSLVAPDGSERWPMTVLLPGSGAGRGIWRAYAFWGLSGLEVWESGTYHVRVRGTVAGLSVVLAEARVDVVTDIAGPPIAPPAPVTTGASAVVGGLLDALSAAIGPAVRAGEDALRALQAALGGALTTAGSAADEALRELEAALLDALAVAGNAGDGALRALQDAVNAALAALGPAQRDLQGAVGSAADTAARAAADAVRDLEAALGDAETRLREAGEDVAALLGDVVAPLALLGDAVWSGFLGIIGADAQRIMREVQ